MLEPFAVSRQVDSSRLRLHRLPDARDSRQRTVPCTREAQDQTYDQKNMFAFVEGDTPEDDLVMRRRAK